VGGNRVNRRRARRVALAVAAGFGTLVAGIAPGSAVAAPTVVARYEMNEPPGASTMVDSSGFGSNGVVRSGVVTGATAQGATGYRWSNTSPTAPPAKPERIIQVPDTTRLDPEGATYVVEFRYRTTRSFGNVVQKGQNKTSGGYFKFEQPKGFMTCLFKGGNGQQRAVKSPVATNDGNWHTIRCERSAWGVKLWVDGKLVRQLAGPTGTISNSKPLVIGGKLECDQVSVTCDYFVGDIDRVQITKG
jgi:Laminin G domain